MMVSHLHRVIFVHIHKTGGSSVESALDEEEKLNTGRGGALGGPTKHMTDVEIHRRLSDAQWTDYRKFTIVRNPWARVHSMWYSVEGRKQSHTPFPDWYHEQITDDELTWLTKPRWSMPLHCWVRPWNMKHYRFLSFENLQETFDHLCVAWELPMRPLPHLLLRDKSDRKPYPEDYDERTKEAVWMRYDHEIMRFQYRYGEDTK